MYLKWSIILSIFEGHRVVLVVPYSNTNVCCPSPLIVGVAMTDETGIRTNIQSFPLATLPRQNFSARNICCLLHSIVAVMTHESLGLSIRVHSSLSLECHRVAKKIMIDLLDGSQVVREAQLYDTRRQQPFFLSCDKMIAEKRAVVRRPMVTVDSGRSCERNIFPDGT